MANIEVNDIKLAGTQLFEDGESFISDLEDNELELTGGINFACACCYTSHNGTIATIVDPVPTGFPTTTAPIEIDFMMVEAM
ncbi:MAG: hypothetical protein QNJ47_15120 [Nostocaceae cyanobacterium]|nr:hypothetical protein [Nostocaceae cyanobacterium]